MVNYPTSLLLLRYHLLYETVSCSIKKMTLLGEVLVKPQTFTVKKTKLSANTLESNA